MKFRSITEFLILSVLSFTSTSLSSQASEKKLSESQIETDFSDREAIMKTIENFYIGDHTGSIKHKKLSMHENGAYRYVNREGVYKESTFQLDSDDSDQNYKEELLSIEIYNTVALARLRLDQFNYDKPEYKLMTLHETKEGWKITSITWGFGITQ